MFRIWHRIFNLALLQGLRRSALDVVGAWWESASGPALEHG
jgi:hypothetical protein